MSETPSEAEVWAPGRRTTVSRSIVMRGASEPEPLTELRPGAAPRKGCAATPDPDSASDVGGRVVSAGALDGLVGRTTAPTRAWARSRYSARRPVVSIARRKA